jgi:hypothetical protein
MSDRSCNIHINNYGRSLLDIESPCNIHINNDGRSLLGMEIL